MQLVKILIPVMLVVGAAVQLLGSSQDFIQFHQRFFRSPGDRTGFFVLYDPLDQAYWEQYYQLNFRLEPSQDFRQVPLFPPAPIQESIYIPQVSVWNGYPIMLGEGVDNFWVRLFGDARAEPAQP